MKNLMAICLAFVILLWGIPTKALNLSAVSAVVIDAESGEILFEKNPEDKMGMASTTKIMTAIVALEKGNPKEIVKVSPTAAGVEGSSMYLKSGEKISLENLIYGLMLVSGNDAASAIAQHISGSEEKFAKLMNEKAREIGAMNTSFTNPHGLSDEKHYTTAYDLAKITAYGLRNSVFASIVSTKSKTVEREGLGRTTLVNHNKLLKSYDGCIGVKTGFTKATGRCLVSASYRNGLKIVCVTLNAGDDWNDHRKMSDYVFENYKATLYKREGTLAKTLKVKNGTSDTLNGIFGEDVFLLEKEDNEWFLNISVPDEIPAPVKKGEVIGMVVAEHETGRKQSFDIIAEKDVLKIPVFDKNSMIGNTVKIYKKWVCFFASVKIN